jgi:DNA-binding SARP family transcriptional activator
VVEFRILGSLQVLKGGRALPLGGAKQRGLLALLLLDRNRVVPRDRLIDALWPDDPPASAANSVHVYVSRLRRLLEGEAPGDGSTLVTEAPGYSLRTPAGAVDADEFERLVGEGRTALAAGSFAAAEQVLSTGLALWRGPALADLASELYAQPEIARLEALRLEALEARFEAMLSAGRQTEAVGELQALVSLHPLDERLRAQLMLALYRSGRQADALETYRAFRRLASEELGLEPGLELRELEQAMLRQDPSLHRAELSPQPSDARQTVETPRTVPAPPRLREDEHRPVTALFADIVGSTALGERLAPDEAAVLVGECVTMMSRAVEEYGGTVQAFEGDGICAYFGVPAAHEDDAERAALAALRILDAVRGYAHDVERAWEISGFAVRVGISTGPASVGFVGASNRQTVALGDSTNVAARLQAAAEPGAIFISESTAHLLDTRFVLEPLGEIGVKGRQEPVTASRLVGTKPHEPRAPAPPLLGREPELERISEVVEDLTSGRGRVVLLEGPPGIGKSRLLAELEVIVGERATWLEGQCHSYGRVPCSAFVEILFQWLGAEPDEPEIAVRTKARAGLGKLLGSELETVLVPLAPLLRIRVDSPVAPADEDTRRAYLRWLEALATERPAIVAVEDAQWADRSARELMEELLSLTDRAPVALVLTEEPIPGSEGAALRTRALADYGHRTVTLSLGPIADEAAEHLLVRLVGDEIDATTRVRLIREAEGNPLYLEELARSFLEGALEPRGRTWTLTMRSLDLLPPTLENLLVARIDRQPDGPRRLAQIAAAIGRTFPVRVLERIAGERIDEALTALLHAEIVREVRRYPELECAFTHGLLREAVLSTLTSARRRSLFATIAEAFEALYADSLDDHFERLAHYHAQAGDLPRALEYAELARNASS